MKNLFLKSILLIVPILVLMAGTNYYIDPAHQFSEEYYRKAANLLKHDNIVLAGNCDERKLLNYFVKQKSKVELIILGSSRSLIIDQEHVNSNSILNLCSSGSDFEDLIATYYLYESTHGKPQKVLIGIDPWMFNINRKSNRYLKFGDYYDKMADKLNIPPTADQLEQESALETLFSLDYFQSSLLSLIEHGVDGATTQIIKGAESEQKIKTSNGTLKYGKNWQTHKNMIEIAAKRYIASGEIYGFSNFSEVSSERVQKFELFFNYLKDKGVSAEVFLSAYHPMVWDYFELNSEKYSPIFKSEQSIIVLCAKYDIPIIGSFSPKKTNLVSTDFYDGMHLNLTGLQKVFTAP